MTKFDTSRFLPSFFDEVRERLLSINRCLVLLEAGTLDAGGLNLLRRDVHTIKGSAQMLGVQDVSELGHLFEDAVEYTMKHSPTHASAMIQFLYDLHDSLQERVRHHGAEHRPDSTTQLRERFELLRISLQAQASKKSDKSKGETKQREATPTGKTQYRGKLSKDIFAAPMKHSQEHIDAQVKAMRAADKEAGKVDFRPADEAVETLEQLRSSGNFQRVDQARLLYLSNQIIELASDRYRPDACEAQLRDQMFGLMLRPLANVFSMFPHAVRDLAASYGKKVKLLITGESIEMDQFAVEALSEPLVHLINNAIAHGVENSAERLELGKPEEAQITVAARRQGDMVSIDVMDDGHGMDVDDIRRKAIAKGLISAVEAEDMDEDEVLELISHPGFSTRTAINSLAGRGMGMSVVQDVMRELTGTIHMHSEKGRGTRFRLTLPLAVGLQQVVVFRIGNQRFGMIGNLVEKILPLHEQAIRQGHGPYARDYIDYEHQRVPVIDLCETLVVGGLCQSDAQLSILMIEYLEGYLGLVVDEIFDSQQVMVRELESYLRYYQPVGLMGCAIIDDGSVLLLIEPNGLKHMWQTAPDVDIDV